MPFLGDRSMHIYDVHVCVHVQASARLSFFLCSHTLCPVISFHGQPVSVL
jgi:hypothetical protein